MTIKSVREQYMGRRFHESDPFSVITKVVGMRQHDGRQTAVLISGSTGDYDVEAIIDRGDGSNLVEGHCRHAQTLDDAMDSAGEMYYEYVVRG